MLDVYISYPNHFAQQDLLDLNIFLNAISNILFICSKFGITIPRGGDKYTLSNNWLICHTSVIHFLLVLSLINFLLMIFLAICLTSP